MPNTVKLVRDTFALRIRLPFLLLGLPFLGLGLFASAKVVLAIIDLALGRPFEGNFLIGFLLAATFTLVGGACVAAFFLPNRVMVFDGDTKVLTYTRVFPFDIKRAATFAFATLPWPEAVWIEDSDRANGGYWVLKVILPNKRSVIFPTDGDWPSQQRYEAEVLRDEILALMNAD